MITIQTKIKDTKIYPILNKISDLFCALERQLYNDLMKGPNKPKKDIKRNYLSIYNIPARFFNSLLYNVSGLIKSQKTIIDGRKDLIGRKIKDITKDLKKLTKKKKSLDKSSKKYKKCNTKVHWLGVKKDRYYEELKTIENRRVVFGGKKFFLQQFTNPEYLNNHKKWLLEWKEKRSDHFFLVGSKDESFGNQLCQLQGNLLQVRIPDCLSELGRIIKIPVEFNYYQEYLQDAIKNETAMSYRFVRKDNSWYIFLSFELNKIPEVCYKKQGCIGIDINEDNISASELDRSGNMIDFKTFKYNTHSKRMAQTKDILGRLVKEAMDWAEVKKKPIVIEKLNFKGKDFNRHLSKFSYSYIIKLLKSQSEKRLIEVTEVNPAYTSVIGKFKYSKRKGISTHIASSGVIARRGMGITKEKTTDEMFGLLPSGIRPGHHWSHWSYLSKRYPNRVPEVLSDWRLDLSGRIGHRSTLGAVDAGKTGPGAKSCFSSLEAGWWQKCYHF
jgi:IS605 OrfB family transposase